MSLLGDFNFNYTTMTTIIKICSAVLTIAALLKTVTNRAVCLGEEKAKDMISSQVRVMYLIQGVWTGLEVSHTIKS